jgi:hypothetical protein
MRLILILVCAAHIALGITNTIIEGYDSVFPPFAQLWAWQMFFDLLFALALVHLLFWNHNRSNGRSLTPVWISAVATIFLGTIAPLIYLIWDKEMLATDS